MKLQIKYLSILLFTILILSIFFSTSFASNNKLKTYSPSCILIDSNSGKILYEKNAYKKMYPASTTKIMTAIIALEKCKLTEITTVSDNAVSLESVPETYTRANLKAGENLSIENLLNVLLIPSANDAAIVIAEHISGSVEEFSKEMNKKAKELGCQNTNFVNPNGVHDSNQYTTAFDLSLIATHAMKNEEFRKIVSKTSYTLPSTNKYNKEDRTFNNTNELLNKDSNNLQNYYYQYTTGVKTGYTDAAKNCIVASAKKDNYEFIAVILGADTPTSEKNDRATDCINLFNYAIENYKEQTVTDKNLVLKQIDLTLSDNTIKTLNIIAEKNIKITTCENIEKIVPTITINENLRAPILKGSVVGKISYTIDGETISCNLIAENNVLDSETLPIIFTILICILIFFLLLSFTKIKKIKKSDDVFMKFYK